MHGLTTGAMTDDKHNVDDFRGPRAEVAAPPPRSIAALAAMMEALSALFARFRGAPAQADTTAGGAPFERACASVLTSARIFLIVRQ